MRIDPLKVIGEILGEPADQMRNPVNADYRCPFINAQCVKKSQAISGPFPVCTIWHGGRRSGRDPQLMCVCPKRLYQIDIVNDVINHCWPPGDAPANPRVAYEVNMAEFGKVDMVIADLDDRTEDVKNFVSVELQAVDISGSYVPAYEGVLYGRDEVSVTYGINWKNVRKRFISQLIDKGIYHYHWGTRIVAVIQTPLYNELHRTIQFDELASDAGGNTIIFMLYDYQPDSAFPGAYRLELDRVVGTSHNSLMMASLYHPVPSKEVFHKRIISNLVR